MAWLEPQSCPHEGLSHNRLPIYGFYSLSSKVGVLKRALVPRRSCGHGIKQRAVTCSKACPLGRASCV